MSINKFTVKYKATYLFYNAHVTYTELFIYLHNNERQFNR